MAQVEEHTKSYDVDIIKSQSYWHRKERTY